MANTPRPPTLVNRRWLRIGLAALAFEMLLIGVPASIAPPWFFDWFLLGRGWAGAIGPYNEHYVFDLGLVYVSLGVVLVWAALRLGRELCRASLVASIVANAPHLVYHLNHTHELSLADNVAQDGLLMLLVLVAIQLLVLIARRPEAAEMPSAAVLTRPESPVGQAADGAR